jgi:two-component system, chemotaxis family, response regulator Rcp1
MTELLRPIEILLVEDNPGDVELTRRALSRAKMRISLHAVEDGEEAMEFLNREGEFSEAPRPDLILLDLNLPRMDGREVLEAVKADERLMTIPIVVLTSSAAEADILGSYKRHANMFITKPVDLEQFVEVVKSIPDFWFSVVKLPNP